MSVSPNSASIRVLVLAGLVSVGTQVHAAGFQLTEQSVSGMGRAFAGGSSPGDDLSAIFYNPAEMTLVEGTAVQQNVTYINVTAEYTDQGSSRSLPTPSGRVTVPSDGRLTDDAGTDAVVPTLYAVTDINDRIKAGIGVTVPFGLRTDYGRSWVGRYHAVESELKTIDVAPSIAYQVNDQLSVGAGISFQYAEATLSQAIFTGTAQDGFVEVTGDNWAVGYNLGASYQLNPNTRFGIGFRSKVEQTVEGDRTLSGVGPLSGTVGVEATVTLPETVYLTGYHRLDDKWALMGTARWTNWSRFDELRLEFEDGTESVTEEKWDDTWFLSLGVEYDYRPDLRLRAGVAYDQMAVTSDELRTPRIPDADRTWLSVGFSYQPSDNLALDAGYTHIFTDDADVINTLPIASTPAGPVFDTLRGGFEGDVDIIGVQLTYRF